MAKKPTLTPQQKADKALGKFYGTEGVNAGNALINKFLTPGSLGRVSTDVFGTDPNQKDVEGVQGSLKRYSNLYETTQGRDPIQSQVLANMQAGLGGYTSPEYQAQREQQMRGMQSNYLTSAGQLMRAQARGKVYGAAGAAQMANLQRSTQQSKDQLEQDLYVKNIDEMSRRNLEYGKYAADLSQSEYDRRADATKMYGDELTGLRKEQLDREKLGLGQSNAELAAQIGAFTGAGAQAIAKKQNKQSYKLQKQGLDIIKGM